MTPASSSTCPAEGPTFARGTLLEVTGKLAAPYGQLEIRPSKGAVRSLGTGVLPTPMTIPVAGLDRSERRPPGDHDRPAHDEAEEELGRRHDPRHRTGRRRTDQGHGRRLEPDQPRLAQGRRDVPDHGLRRSARHAERRPRRLSGLGARSRRCRRGGRAATVRRLPRRAPVRPGPPSTAMSIAKALHVTDRTVAIEAIVTAPATLLDATGRRIVVQDCVGRRGDPAADRDACARGRVEDPRRGSDRRRLRRAASPGRQARRHGQRVPAGPGDPPRFAGRRAGVAPRDGDRAGGQRREAR